MTRTHRTWLIGSASIAALATVSPADLSALQQSPGEWRRADIELTRLVAEDLAAARKAALRLIEEEGPEADLSTLPPVNYRHQEYYTRVIQPRIKAARTCRERVDAITAFAGFLRRQELLGSDVTIGTEEFGDLTVGKYADETHERCMNEAYRRCVVNDDPAEVFAMVRLVLGRERQRQLLGGAEESQLSAGDELDPRITACRGPWYNVRFVREEREDGGTVHFRDEVEGWTGRGLHDSFHRKAVSHGVGAKCPDGGCDGECHVTEIGEGDASVEPKPWYREFYIRSQRGRYKIRKTEDNCPRDASPDMMDPSVTYSVRVPGADPVTPLVQGPPEMSQVPVNAGAIASIDPWKTMFAGEGAVDLIDADDEQKHGTIEVLAVCDGKEMFGRGTPGCSGIWKKMLAAYEKAAPADRK